MIGAGTSSLGKKICLAVKQFNIDTVVLGKQGLGSIKSGLGSSSSYVVENCECSVMIVKAPVDNVVSDQERLTNSIQCEKLIDISYAGDKDTKDSKEPTIQYDGQAFVEFVLEDIDSVMEQFKAEQEELMESLMKEEKGCEEKLKQSRGGKPRLDEPVNGGSALV